MIEQMNYEKNFYIKFHFLSHHYLKKKIHDQSFPDIVSTNNEHKKSSLKRLLEYLKC